MEQLARTDGTLPGPEGALLDRTGSERRETLLGGRPDFCKPNGLSTAGDVGMFSGPRPEPRRNRRQPQSRAEAPAGSGMEMTEGSFFKN